MQPIKNIVITPSAKEKSEEETVRIIKWLEDRKIKVMLPRGRGESIDCERLDSDTSEIRSKADLMLSLGGDGTLLQAAKIVFGTDIPILGINLGHLGFLTETTLDDWEISLNRTLEGDYTLWNRMAVSCSIIRDGQQIFSGSALNDAVIHNGGEMNLLKLAMKISGNYAGAYSADGMIISTPTGSTAYSMSAGGPIVNPRVECMILAAICPHTLSARPLVISPDEEVEIRERSGKSCLIYLDGHTVFKVMPKDSVIIKKSPNYSRFVSLGKNFYTTIREKLKWFE